ncbi:unnamed protein product [Rotaria socialis]|uniref:Uncharacterized protein n=1 Tax=Rotaria socialis TaxID=392032 RepID=A0A820T1L5_9BILA|nr:unnamed protein product [Rotaria socialis]CAF4463628.1 unnamed protein product [Rotaria socialis]
MVNIKVSFILIIAGLLCLTSVIMSLYSISTAEWSIIGTFSIGLFQTCTISQCMKNRYENINNETEPPIIFSKRFYNVAPLSVVGVFIQLVVCFLFFFTAFRYLPLKPSITCYITPLLIFIAFLFQLSTLTEASRGIYLNGRSSVVFEVTLVLQVIAIVISIMVADQVKKTAGIEDA